MELTAEELERAAKASETWPSEVDGSVYWGYTRDADGEVVPYVEYATPTIISDYYG